MAKLFLKIKCLNFNKMRSELSQGTLLLQTNE